VGAYAYETAGPSTLTLTGIVTRTDVIVSSQVAGQLGQLLGATADTVRSGRSWPG